MNKNRTHSETKNNSTERRVDTKFLNDIQRSVKEKIMFVKNQDGKLLVHKKMYTDEVLQILREAFISVLNNIQTFKPLLTEIKVAYENGIAVRDEQIKMKNTLLRVIEKEKKSEKLEIEKLLNENKKLTEKIKQLENTIQEMKIDNKKVKAECSTALQDEINTSNKLQFENENLRFQIDTMSHTENNSEENNGKDPVILNLALDQCRKTLSKTVKELNTMTEDYADVVPKSEFETLETSFAALNRSYQGVTKDLAEKRGAYNELLEKHSALQRDALILKDRCADIEEFGTPRPHWEACGDFVGGGGERWRLLGAGLSSREKLGVLLRELGPASHNNNQEYFDSLGKDPIIPPYLVHEGKVRNLRLSRRDLSIIINGIWTSKEASGREISMQDFLLHYFRDRYQQKSVRAEWAYNLYNGCEQMLDDHQMKLFWGALKGTASQDMYYSLKREWKLLQENTNKMLIGEKDKISMEDLEKAIKSSFPLKTDVEVKNIMEVARRTLKIKMNATEIDVNKLFLENEEGFERMDVAKELLRQRQINQDKYVKEIINQLGGKRHPNKLISVENLKRAIVVVDPHIDLKRLEGYMRWAFSDKMSNLNMMYPITLKVLAAKLSSGDIQRVGPRNKGRTSKTHKY